MDYCITVGERCDEGKRLTVLPYADRPRLRELGQASEQDTEQESTMREEPDVGYTAPPPLLRHLRDREWRRRVLPSNDGRSVSLETGLDETSNTSAPRRAGRRRLLMTLS